ncbi:MAG TPA: hypothetical protein VFP95_07045, partial [Gammaproteobacteria bacterium]|nr:hypothetical protein [Gammaproteobacteria bacterium]
MRAPFPKSLDNAQRLRLRRTLLGYSGYLIYVAPLAYIQYFGWSAWGAWGLFWIVLAATALNAVFVGLTLSGLNKHFADPSMTLLQITAAIVFALILIYITPEARGVLLFLFMTSLFFGVFRLRMHEFLGLVLFS